MSFPSHPNNGDTTTINNQTYVYNSGQNAWYIASSNPQSLHLTGTADAYNTQSGTLVVDGGVGVAGRVYAGSFYSDNYYYSNGAVFSGSTGIGNAPIKTFNIIGNFTAPLMGTSVFVPAYNTTIQGVLLTNGTQTGSDLTVGLYRNQVFQAFYTIPAGNFTSKYNNQNIQIRTSDYITVSVISGTGSNFSMVLYNTVLS
jgi:hypothetical protein